MWCSQPLPGPGPFKSQDGGPGAVLGWQASRCFLLQQPLSSDCSSAHGCLETPWAGHEHGEWKEPSSVLVDGLGLQGCAGLEP